MVIIQTFKLDKPIVANSVRKLFFHMFTDIKKIKAFKIPIMALMEHYQNYQNFTKRHNNLPL